MSFQIVQDEPAFVSIDQRTRPAAGVAQLAQNDKGVGGVTAAPNGSVDTANLIVFLRIAIHRKYDVQCCVAYAEYLRHASRLRGMDALSTRNG